MATVGGFRIRQLSPDDGLLMNALLGVFGKAFDDVETYGSKLPRPVYLRLLHLRPRRRRGTQAQGHRNGADP
jgi:hypothetical protein